MDHLFRTFILLFLLIVIKMIFLYTLKDYEMLPIESNARNFKKIENEAIIICKYEYSCKYILSLLNIYRQGDENMRKLF